MGRAFGGRMVNVSVNVLPDTSVHGDLRERFRKIVEDFADHMEPNVGRVKTAELVSAEQTGNLRRNGWLVSGRFVFAYRIGQVAA